MTSNFSNNSQQQLHLQELLANPLLVLASRHGLRANIDTSTLLYLQGYRNELAIALCNKLINAGSAADLAASAQDIAYTKGKLDFIEEMISSSQVDSSLISTEPQG